MRMQSTSEILMIRPSIAASNPETLASNAFQSLHTPENALQLIHQEFDQAVLNLQSAGITVHVIADTETPPTPDAIFPNNWFSTEGETLTLYPMLAPSRADEAKPAPLNFLKKRYSKVIDIRELPPLEGTGALVLDHTNRHAFIARSPRASLQTLSHWAQTTGYGFTMFDTADTNGQAIYHTNVMMSIGTTWAVIATDSITNPESRLEIYEHLETREIIEISLTQMNAFAGNMIELTNAENQKHIILSQTAFDSLTNEQKETLRKHGELLPIAIPTIELIGGGSIRCMIAELF